VGSFRARLITPLLVLTLLIAAAVRFWGLDFGLPHTQARPDETYIIDVTLALLRGVWPPPNYDYPWLYAMLLTGMYQPYFLWGLWHGSFQSLADLAASWPLHWEPFFLISRSLSAMAGTATVFVLYWIGRGIWNPRTGVAAAFLLSVAFLHVRDSHYGTTDILMTLFIMTAVGLLLRAHLTGRRASFVVAGAVAGLAVGTKYNAALLAAPALVSYFIDIVDSPGRRVRAIVGLRLWLFAVPFIVVFLLAAPFIVLDSSRFLDSLNLLRDSMQAGHGALELERGWEHHLKLSLRYGLGLPLLAAGVLGAATIFVREWRIGALLLAFPIAYYVVAGFSRNQFFRYVIPVVPFLCLTAARLVFLAADGLGRLQGFGRGRSNEVLPAVAGAVLTIAIAMPSAVSVWQFDRIMARTDNRVVIADWFARNVPPGQSILQSGSFYGHVQFAPEPEYTHWVWDRFRQRFMVNGQDPEGRPDWILIQESPLPSSTQDVVTEFLREGYVFAWQFQAMPLRGQNRIFDQEDAFFVPFAGFDGVRRPGPNFTLYRRADLAFSGEGLSGQEPGDGTNDRE
jgi:4-amino-4-deoxy-L-arabinose transferase-like glycosyltransferase